MKITALAGGIGGARFLRGLRDVLATDPTYGSAGSDPAEITVIVNTADDVTLFGLRVCPDLDTVMYTLGGGIHEEQGWGRAAETFTVKEELAAYGAQPQWFGLGDRDLATHIVRTQMLDQGYPLSAVTEALCVRWEPGVRLLPMSDERVETHVTIGDGRGPARRPLPGMVGAPARSRAGPRRSPRSGSRTPSLRPVCSRPSTAPTWSCCRRRTRSCRSARSSRCPG